MTDRALSSLLYLLRARTSAKTRNGKNPAGPLGMSLDVEAPNRGRPPSNFRDSVATLLQLRYSDRRKFKISCFCDELRALKLAITPLASDPQNWVFESGW